MKSVKRYRSLVLILAVCLLSGVELVAAQNTLSPADQKTAIDFEVKAKAYAKLREQIEKDLPALPKEATPEQIDAHKISFQKAMLSARQRAKRGNLFNPASAALIRKIIRTEYKGAELTELRETVLEAETKGVPVRINYTYPENKELVEMPPNLLLKLPQLPKQLRFRFVGQNLLVVDRENGLIVDYMTKALP